MGERGLRTLERGRESVDDRIGTHRLIAESIPCAKKTLLIGYLFLFGKIVRKIWTKTTTFI